MIDEFKRLTTGGKATVVGLAIGILGLLVLILLEFVIFLYLNIVLSNLMAVVFIVIFYVYLLFIVLLGIASFWTIQIEEDSQMVNDAKQLPKRTRIKDKIEKTPPSKEKPKVQRKLESDELHFDNLNKNTVKELKAYCRKYDIDLPSTIRKAEIIKIIKEESAKRLSSSNKHNPKTLITLANSHKYSGDFTKAIQLYEKALKIEPNDKEAWCSLALVYNNVDNYENAIQAAKKATELDPNHQFAWNILALAYMKAKRYQEAITTYEKAISIDSGKKQVWSNLGKLYYKTENYTKAAESLKKSLDLDAKYPDIWYLLSKAYSASKRYDLAMNAIDKSLELDPEYDNAKKFKLILSSKKKGRD